jgi:hypothetical protein
LIPNFSSAGKPILLNIFSKKSLLMVYRKIKNIAGIALSEPVENNKPKILVVRFNSPGAHQTWVFEDVDNFANCIRLPRDFLC